jgi:hypothetical protein
VTGFAALNPSYALIGFASEDDWRDYQIENDSRFLRRVEKAIASLRAGRGVRNGMSNSGP